MEFLIEQTVLSIIHHLNLWQCFSVKISALAADLCVIQPFHLIQLETTVIFQLTNPFLIYMYIYICVYMYVYTCSVAIFLGNQAVHVTVMLQLPVCWHQNRKRRESSTLELQDTEIQYCVRFLLGVLPCVHLLMRSDLYQALTEASLKETIER